MGENFIHFEENGPIHRAIVRLRVLKNCVAWNGFYISPNFLRFLRTNPLSGRVPSTSEILTFHPRRACENQIFIANGVKKLRFEWYWSRDESTSRKYFLPPVIFQTWKRGINVAALVSSCGEIFPARVEGRETRRRGRTVLNARQKRNTSSPRDTRSPSSSPSGFAPSSAINWRLRRIPDDKSHPVLPATAGCYLFNG